MTDEEHAAAIKAAIGKFNAAARNALNDGAYVSAETVQEDYGGGRKVTYIQAKIMRVLK